MQYGRKEVKKMKKENKLEKVMFIIAILATGFFSGILFSIYNLKITDVKKWDNGELITIKILERSSDYYYEK